tara:strand:+ start:327 stop:815 length:489 start_codon:yes stop_codon:yes gene_type:complete
MSKNTTKYRALSPDEIHEPGDEYKDSQGNWWPVGKDAAGGRVGSQIPCRRPITEPESPWIPIGAPPTLEDGDERGKVLVRRRDGSVDSWSWANVGNQTWAPHWMPIPPLPEPDPTKNERLARRIVAAITPDLSIKKSVSKNLSIKKSVSKKILDVLNREIPE